MGILESFTNFLADNKLVVRKIEHQRCSISVETNDDIKESDCYLNDGEQN